MSIPSIEIASVQLHEIDEVIDFVMAARAELFPAIAGVRPADLQNFAEVYLSGGDGAFWLARSDGQLVAVVGYLPYDHRFSQLDYRGLRTVEVVRLFVVPALRRVGLAAQLLAHLHEHAAAMGVQVLYLHTQRFLPGATDFWEKLGFVITDVESDPLWQTTHMQYVMPDVQ